MTWWKSDSRSRAQKQTSWENRRKEPRITCQLNARYSGADGSKIIMGWARVVDLSRHGFGLQGARGVKPGMELALFLELPETKDRICIPQTYDSWTNGRRFGVEVRGEDDREAVWLEPFSLEY